MSMALIPLLLLAVGAAFWYRRLHLMVNHPDKYERFHRAEMEFAKVQVAATERAARGLVAAVRAMARLLSKKFKRV
jgi:hypothetical protein